MIKKSMDESNQGFMKHLGGLELKKVSETQYEFTVEVKEIHLNTGKIAHGGFLSTIADTGMGTAAHRVAGDKRCVTINLDMKFISIGQLGDKLIGKVKILKITKNIKDAILRKATTQEIKDVAKKDNFRTMQDMGRELLLTGDLSFAEYQRILAVD